jgi:hypothetical protein
MRRAKESSTPNPGVTTLVRGDSWRERLKRVIGEVPEWLNGAVSKTVVDLVSTVGSNPTLSAERITFRASSPAATLGERMSKC